MADHLSLGMAEVARRLAHAEAERDALRAALEALIAEADYFKFVVLKPKLYTNRCTQHRAHRYLAAVEAAGWVLHAHGVLAFDLSQPCAMTPGGQPLATQCPRCKNPHHKCDRGTAGVHDPNVPRGEGTATNGVPTSPAWCPIHEHYKWCEHNGGVMGPNGWRAPNGVMAAETQQKGGA